MERVPPRLIFSFITNFVNIQALPHAPKDWQNVKLNYHRSDVYYGMIRSFTVPISYVKDGAKLLRKAFYGDPDTGRLGAFTEANVQLQVQKYNTQTYNYDIVFIGDHDFSTFQDHGIEEGDVVTIEVMEGGITKYVKAYENVKYTIPIPTSGADMRIIDSVPIKLQEKADFIFPPYSTAVEDGYPGLNLVNNDQKATLPSVQSIPNSPSPPPDFSQSTSWFYRATVDGFVSMIGTGIAGNFGNAGIPGIPTIDISIYNQTGAKVYTLYTNTGTDVNFSISFNQSIKVLAGDKLFLFVTFSGAHGKMNLVDGQLTLMYNTISPSTPVYAVSAIYLYQQLMNKMNGFSPVPIRSSLLIKWDGLMLTSGQAIKPFEPTPIYSDGSLDEGLVYFVYIGNITYNGHIFTPGQQFTATQVPSFSSVNPDAYVQQYQPAPVIITSFKDFFKSINAVLNAGWGVENNVATLEAKSYFYKSQLPPMNFGKVSKFVGGKPSISNLFSSVKYGYADQSYDQLSAVYEFNSQATASFPLKSINKELDLMSEYRADSTGYELLRVGLNQDSSGASSTSGNNDVWFVYCVPTATPQHYEQEQPSAFSNLIGINTNLFNLRISPKENLTRWGDYLASCLYGLKGEYIRFANGFKNVNLSHVNAGVRITENADIAIGDLPAPIFYPFEATITTKEPSNVMALLDRMPTGSIDFEVFSGIKLNGFIIDCNTDVPLNSPQQITVLYTPNNNLLECVR